MRNYLGRIYDHATLGGGDQLVEGIPDAEQARVRRAAIVHHVKPVAVVHVARAAPFVLGELDIAHARPPLYLDRVPCQMLAMCSQDV